MSTDKNFEEKLETWRREAKHGDVVTGRGVDVAGGPIPETRRLLWRSGR